jgi:hypothetical protein
LFWSLAEGDLIRKDSFIIEIASNDGYMLSNFTKNGYENVLGIEPAQNVARDAVSKGIPTVNDFFTRSLAGRIAVSQKADCIIALNVLAHVPDITNFLTGVRDLLKNDGFAILEFHHLLNLLDKKQFDTIYHEHFSYLSLFTVEYVLSLIGMRVFRAERLATQGGSLRLYISQKKDSAIKKYPLDESVDFIRQAESDFDLRNPDLYNTFAGDVRRNVDEARVFLLKLIESGKTLAGYGAAAKAVVFINATGLTKENLLCVADVNPVKQGNNIPGTAIPIVTPDELISLDPDYVIIFPWNLRDEISSYLRGKMTGSTDFIVFTPSPDLFK